ncbi:hypothetical protein PROFUN_02019 [Planoprotostelium fungivorum]|uniref:Uncharacterized protein n=1 Tax=Planoprotostelium fungivorum TaxID=1890364 RepID=A0A2P6NB53_9EUKA|nr:hypothetical protein PROFUN_02019 [Planoprotostelium fungivorum]
MCKKVTCSTCQKLSWEGCGKHLDTVYTGVPEEQRCRCNPDKVATEKAAGF